MSEGQTGIDAGLLRREVDPLDVRMRELSPAADAVVALFEGLFTDLELMRRSVVDLFAAGPVGSAAVVGNVEPHARALLDRGLVLGAGFVAAREALTDKSLYLAWWQGEDQSLLGQADSPVSGDSFDYTRREWFRRPEQTERRHVAGPYVDYVCTDEYVCTSTLPVVVDGRMVGVVGADTLVETLEGVLLDTMVQAGATLVNEQGRTVVSADPQLAAGTIIDLAACRDRVDCADFPLVVVPA